MTQPASQNKFSLSTGIDLAFALVVFVTYFTAFSTSAISSLFLITIIVFLGIAYVSNGIYGFSFARKSNSLFIKIIYFLLQFIFGGLIIYYGRGAGFSALILLPVVAHTAILLDEDWALIANVGVFFTFVLSVWSYSHTFQHLWQSLPTFFVGQVFILIFTQMAFTEQRAREKLEVLAKELADANKHLSDYADQVHDLAIAQERNRFAREIHDGLGQYLTTISMQINAASVVTRKNPEEALHILENAKKLSVEALEDVRNSVYALRKDTYEIDNLVARINGVITELKSPEREIIFQVKGTPRVIPPQADQTLYRSAQESMNNAQKYSQATKVEIILDYSSPEKVELTVADNGVGADDLEKGFGLIGIKERARLLNGEVTIDSVTGSGFSIKISIPG